MQFYILHEKMKVSVNFIFFEKCHFENNYSGGVSDAPDVATQIFGLFV